MYLQKRCHMIGKFSDATAKKDVAVIIIDDL
jgi:hypothetical protein